MLNLSADQPEEKARQPEHESTGLLGLVDYAVPEVSERVEAAIRAEREHALVMLDQAISPPPRSIRDRLVVIGLVASVLFHLGVILLLPQGEKLYREIAGVRPPPEEKIPPVYLFPYLQHDKSETPSKRHSPRSDLSRRAHGGEGQPDTRPGSRGNTPEPRLEPPPGRPAAVTPPAAPRGGAEVPPAVQSDESQTAQASKVPGGDANGADAVLHARRSGAQAAQPVLRGLPVVGRPGGLGGGAVPDRRGGQVDLGPLSFDTEWYDWGAYAAEMLRRIKYHWMIPEIAQFGVPGVVRVRFYIERDGHVTGVTILSESGHPSMDFAARDAILNASPLPPLPADLTGVDHEGVTIAFFYNTKPPET
ncbi:MAG: energy transducer TonB [Acidobacteriota bacterium]